MDKERVRNKRILWAGVSLIITGIAMWGLNIYTIGAPFVTDCGNGMGKGQKELNAASERLDEVIPIGKTICADMQELGRCEWELLECRRRIVEYEKKRVE